MHLPVRSVASVPAIVLQASFVLAWGSGEGAGGGGGSSNAGSRVDSGAPGARGSVIDESKLVDLAWAFDEHRGTHLDSPIHFAKGRRTLDASLSRAATRGILNARSKT